MLRAQQKQVIGNFYMNFNKVILILMSLFISTNAIARVDIQDVSIVAPNTQVSVDLNSLDKDGNNFTNPDKKFRVKKDGWMCFDKIDEQHMKNLAKYRDLTQRLRIYNTNIENLLQIQQSFKKNSKLSIKLIKIAQKRILDSSLGSIVTFAKAHQKIYSATTGTPKAAATFFHLTLDHESIISLTRVVTKGVENVSDDGTTRTRMIGPCFNTSHVVKFLSKLIVASNTLLKTAEKAEKITKKSGVGS